MADIIKRCATCACAQKVISPNNLAGVLECHFQPPQLISVTVNAGGGQIAMVPAAAFPNVDPKNGWCCQWREISTLND